MIKISNKQINKKGKLLAELAYKHGSRKSQSPAGLILAAAVVFVEFSPVALSFDPIKTAHCQRKE